MYEEIKKYGYDGKIRILQTFLQSHVSYKPKEELIRFETEPAYQGQVDLICQPKFILRIQHSKPL